MADLFFTDTSSSAILYRKACLLAVQQHAQCVFLRMDKLSSAISLAGAYIEALSAQISK